MEKTRSHNRENARKSRQRSGVGAVVGGTMLAVILFTSVLIYFLSILQTENEKSKNEVQAARFDEEKRLETFVVGPLTTVTDPEGKEFFNVRVHNGGSLPFEARYILVTSENPSTRAETALGEIYTGGQTSQRYLNPGETAEFLANVEGDVIDPDVIYKVNVISSRGNIISVTYPPDSSSGAFNTGANIGDGVPIYLGMGGEDGTVLQFRTLEAGNGIIITEPGEGGEGGNGIGIAIDPDNVLADPRLIQQPQIQPIFPNPFGRTAATGPQALWGAVGRASAREALGTSWSGKPQEHH
jgi:archaellum component FlaF (FlaF/FlaG flagellin family)